MDLFLSASRIKLRFSTPQGVITAEELWDIPLSATRPMKANLNDIAKGLSKSLKDADVENFVEDAAPKDDATKLAFDLVLSVIAIRKEENKARDAAEKAASQKQRILEFIAGKEDEALGSKSIEELRAMLAA